VSLDTPNMDTHRIFITSPSPILIINSYLRVGVKKRNHSYVLKLGTAKLTTGLLVPLWCWYGRDAIAGAPYIQLVSVHTRVVDLFHTSRELVSGLLFFSITIYQIFLSIISLTDYSVRRCASMYLSCKVVQSIDVVHTDTPNFAFPSCHQHDIASRWLVHVWHVLYIHDLPLFCIHNADTCVYLLLSWSHDHNIPIRHVLHPNTRNTYIEFHEPLYSRVCTFEANTMVPFFNTLEFHGADTPDAPTRLRIHSP